MTDHALGWHSVPVWLALAWLASEVGAFAARRLRASRGRGPGDGVALLLWSLRPWGVWALFSLAWRWHAAAMYKHNLRTFPFFANLWEPGQGLGERLALLAGRPSFWLWSALALLALAGLAALARALAPPPDRAPPAQGRLSTASASWLVARLGAVYVLGAALILATMCLPDGAGRRPDGRPGSLTAAWKAHQTVLYATPHIRSTGHYLRHFREIQPRLRTTIHGLSHPPGGSLSLYWIGKAMGVPLGADIRSEAIRLRYLIGLLAFGLLNVGVVALLGRLVFGGWRVGVLAGVLWVVAPTTVLYSTFAQNTLYTVCFTLALALVWYVATAPKRCVGTALLLGALFGGLTLLSYSWCVLTTIFAVFCGVVGVRRRWTWRDVAIRALLPLTVMTLLSGAVLLRYRLDYWAVYSVSSDYVRQWYRFRGLHQWLQALVGGQIDLWLMMGSAALVAFLVSERDARRTGDSPLARAFLWTTLGVLALPLLFGPNPLKMETARCWNWFLPLPFAFAARGLLRHRSARLFVPATVVVSGLTALGMRLFLDFTP